MNHAQPKKTGQEGVPAGSTTHRGGCDEDGGLVTLSAEPALRIGQSGDPRRGGAVSIGAAPPGAPT